MILYKQVSEYDQKIPQSHTAEQPTASKVRATEHLQSQDTRKTIKEKRIALSSSSRFFKITKGMQRCEIYKIWNQLIVSHVSYS